MNKNKYCTTEPIEILFKSFGNAVLSSRKYLGFWPKIRENWPFFIDFKMQSTEFTYYFLNLR